MDITKVKAFLALLATKSVALLTLLDSLLNKMEANPKVMTFLNAHFPGLVKYEKEAHVAIDMLIALEGVPVADAGELVDTLHAMNSVGAAP